MTRTFVQLHLNRFPRHLWLRLKRKALRDGTDLQIVVADCVRRGLQADAQPTMTKDPAYGPEHAPVAKETP